MPVNALLACMIYLAPLQGFTDCIFRQAYASVFAGIDRFFIPYIALQQGEILRKYDREVFPENNNQKLVVPQILAGDEQEARVLMIHLKNYGYSAVNLNLGCPYPMVTNRGRGAALLQKPAKLAKILEAVFSDFGMMISVKLRAGLHRPDELEQIVPVLNEFPLSEVILHARTAKQLYKGALCDPALAFAAATLKHSLVFNGDVFSRDDFRRRAAQFPAVKHWMLGRGVLMNAFLPAQLQGTVFTEAEKRAKLQHFHALVWEAHLRNADNAGNALNKLKQFWQYFSHHFLNQGRVYKSIKKLKAADHLAPLAFQIIQHEDLNPGN